MKYLVILFLGLMTLSVESINATVVTSLKSRNQILITYSGDDLQQFMRLENVIKYSESQIETKCFEVQVVDRFGAPYKEKRCSIILNNNENIEFIAQGNILRFTDKALTSSLRANLQDSKAFVGKVLVNKYVRSCTITNANPNCRRVLSPVPFSSNILKTTGTSAGDFYCISEEYENEKVSTLKGCYLIPSKNRALKGMILKLESLSCDVAIEDEFVAFLKSGETSTNTYVVKYVNLRKTYELSAVGNHPKRKVNSLALFNFNLDSYEFYGKGLKKGDITCLMQKSNNNLDIFFKISCTNHSQTDRYIGRSYQDGSHMKIKACNYPLL